MKERPILFSAPMVRAILDGKKTQTRRVITKKHSASDENRPEHCPYGVPGDHLWLKETWTGTWHSDAMHLHYAADGSERMISAPSGYVLPRAAAKVGGWVTPLFMPRWASRITLEITEVRVQRLQEISGDDCLAEGIRILPVCDVCVGQDQIQFCDATARERIGVYRELWDTINAKRGFNWDANPWVWALEFRRVE